MKIINQIMIGIAVICLLLCGAILVFALNPDMTNSLAQRLYGNTAENGAGTNGTESVGNAISGNGNISVTLPNGLPGDTNGYVAPAMDQMQIPEDVSGKTGFTPVQSEDQEVPDEEAQNLEETLAPGELGENLDFAAEEYPYYQMLSENQQAIYRQIFANAQAVTARFAPEQTVTAGDVRTAFEAVIGDHPELFWLETGYSGKYRGNGQCVEIDLKYNRTVNDLENAKTQFNAAAQNILSGAGALNSDYEKEKYVHDALAAAVSYDLTAEMNQSAYSALVNGRSVCAGYARAYQYLLQQLGIPCYYCTGYSGGDHAWNIVKLDDGYYNVDVTWDDANTIRYDYFNKSDAEYASTHVRQNLSVYLPACNGSAYSQGDAVSSDETTVGDPSGIPDGTGNTSGSTGANGQQISGDSNTGSGEMSAADGSSNDGNGGSTGNNLSDYINPNPQEPLRYPSGSTGDSTNSGSSSGTSSVRTDALNDLTSYYEDCKKQLTALGSGDRHFDNVVPKSLWGAIEQSYNTGAYEQGYVVDVLKSLGMQNFAIQLQIVDIGDGYYRVYHNVVTY